ncbi:MAG: type I-C CRISPR-associated protein Cas5 [Ruminococcus sp.]|nr:type I-C CRISPR-associated protein Cas5 [Ruminococcus sp.]
MSYGFNIIVEADYALFTRPEMKVERVSYDVPTVSALEGLIKSVYWKPAIRFVIDRIVVFNPIKFINIRRNELKSKLPVSAVRSQMKGVGDAVIYADEQRTQRAGMVLRDVKYGIAFHFEMTGNKSDHDDESEEKHYNIMLRRLKNGQCFRQPCMGCREFSVRSIELVEKFDLESVDESLKGDTDLGYMLYGLCFEDGGKPVNGDWNDPRFSDKADAVYYRPHMIDGVIDVNKYREGCLC